jgi:hypothetical protein
MQPLSLFEMIWQLGIISAMLTLILIFIGVVIFAIFKPIEILDNL